MTASMPIVRDLMDLDGRIAQALAILRIARVASARRNSTRNVDAEARAETDLNALLEYRHILVRRSSTPLA
jgi:hypothetical protein